MARRSAIFSCQRRMCIWSSIQKARFSSVVRCSITATTCKKVASKSLTQMPWLTAPAARVSRFERRRAVDELKAWWAPNRLHLHDLGFFVLEMVIDRFDKTIGELLHFILNIAQAVLG